MGKLGQSTEVSAFEKELQRRSSEARSGVRNLSVSTPGKRIEPVDRNKVPKEIRDAAEGMEAMFLDYMLKTMRETIPKNEMDLESPASQIYRGMLDSEYAERAARAGGVGLADQIIAYLQPDRYHLGKGQGVPRVQQSAPQAPNSALRDTGGSQ